MNTRKEVPENFDLYFKTIFERKITGVCALNVTELTSYTDTLVIVEAASHRQVTSLAQHILTRLKAHKIQVIGSEGIKDGEWALLDYGDIVIHIFESDAKKFYDLEGFWADAPRYNLERFDTLTPGEDNDE